MLSSQIEIADDTPDDPPDDEAIAKTAFSIATRYFVIYQRKKDDESRDKTVKHILEAIQALEAVGDNELLSEYYCKKGEIYFFIEDFESALGAYQHAITLYVKDKKNFDGKQLSILAYYYHACGEVNIRLERWSEARNIYEKILSFSLPHTAIYLHVRALCFLSTQYINDKKWKKAINYAEKILPLANQLDTNHIYKKEYLITAHTNLCIAYDQTFNKEMVTSHVLAMVALELNSNYRWEVLPSYLESLLPRFNACFAPYSLTAEIWQQTLDLFDPNKNSHLHGFHNLYLWVTRTPPHQDLLSYQLLILHMEIILKMLEVAQPSSPELITSLNQKPKYLIQFQGKLQKLKEATTSLLNYTLNHPSVYFALINKQQELTEKIATLEKQNRSLRSAQTELVVKLSARNLFRSEFKSKEAIKLSSPPRLGHKRSYSE